MQRKISVRSILFLSLIQIGLLLLLLAWWGGFYQFLLPAAVLGSGGLGNRRLAGCGTAADPVRHEPLL